MTAGWTPYLDKPANIVVPRGDWITITDLIPVTDYGPTLFDPQLYWKTTVKPTTQTVIHRLGRMGRPDGDERWTQRRVLELGDRLTGSGGTPGIEWVSEEDGPFVLQVYHTFPALTMTTVKLNIVNWSAFAAGRIVVPR